MKLRTSKQLSFCVDQWGSITAVILFKINFEDDILCALAMYSFIWDSLYIKYSLKLNLWCRVVKPARAKIRMNSSWHFSPLIDMESDREQIWSQTENRYGVRQRIDMESYIYVYSRFILKYFYLIWNYLSLSFSSFHFFVIKNSAFKYHLATLHFPITVFVWLCRQGRMLRITLGHCTVAGGPTGYLAAILDLRAGRFTFTSSSIFTMYSTFPQYLKIIFFKS